VWAMAEYSPACSLSKGPKMSFFTTVACHIDALSSRTNWTPVYMCMREGEMIAALREITAHFMAAFFSKRCNNAHSDTLGPSVSSRPGATLELGSIFHIFCGHMLALK